MCVKHFPVRLLVSFSYHAYFLCKLTSCYHRCSSSFVLLIETNSVTLEQTNTPSAGNITLHSSSISPPSSGFIWPHISNSFTSPGIPIWLLKFDPNDGTILKLCCTIQQITLYCFSSIILSLLLTSHTAILSVTMLSCIQFLDYLLFCAVIKAKIWVNVTHGRN